MYIGSIATDVKVHAWPTGQLLNTYKVGPHDVLRTLSWGKDGNWLVIVPTEGRAEIIAIRESVLKRLYTIEDIQKPICAVFQNQTKRNVALGTNTGNVLVYDIKTRAVRKHFPRASSAVFRVEYGMKDNYLLAACENGEILSYNSSTMNCSGTYKVPSSRTVSTIRTHIFRRNLFMAGSEEGIVAVWDICRNALIHKNTAHQAIVTDVSFSPIRHDLIVSCGLDRKFSFWDATSKSLVLEKILERSPTAIDFCPDGIGLAVGTQGGSIYTYDTRRMNDPLYIFKAHPTFIKQVLFQKSSSDDSGDFGFGYGNLEANDVLTPRTVDEPMTDTADSFGCMLSNVSAPEEDAEPIESHRTRDSSSDIQQDSFLDAVGLSMNSYRDNTCGPISTGVRKLLDSKPNLLESLAGDQNLNFPRELERNKPNKGGDLKRVNDDLRDTPKNHEYEQFLRLREAAREFVKSEHAHLVKPENEEPQQDPNPPPSKSTPQAIKLDPVVLQSRHQQTDAPPREQMMQGGDHYQQGPLSAGLVTPALKHRQLERIVPSSEVRSQPINEEIQPTSSTSETQKRNSTPKMTTQGAAKTPLPVHISPIISQANVKPAAPEITDFHNTVRQVVKQEVKDQLDSFHQSLKYDIMEVLAQIRRNFLDMQMSIVKEFVQLESSLNRVREDLTSDEGLTDELLIQENMRLRKELAILREQAVRHRDQ